MTTRAPAVLKKGEIEERVISKLKTKGSLRSLAGTRERGERLFWIGTEIIVSSFAMRWTEGKRRKEIKKMKIRSKSISQLFWHIST